MLGGSYVDGDFNPTPRGRGRNCYFSFDYDLNPDQSEYGGFDKLHFEENLSTFLESYYFGCSGYFKARLSALKLAMHQIPTGEIFFEVGHGGGSIMPLIAWF